MTKKIPAGLICLITALALALCACAGKAPGGEGAEDSLTVMGKKTDLERSYLSYVLEGYEKETGRDIELISVEDSQYEAEAARRFREGEAPDVFLHFNNADLAGLDVEKNFLSLDDQSWAGDLTDSALAYCQDRDGNLLGLPFWESSVSGCYYNKTLLDSLGLKAASTQAEFDMLCETLMELGIDPICWPGDGCTWMFQFGLDPIFADDPETLDKLNSGEIKYADIPAVTDMVSWIASAAEKGWFGSRYMETGWSDISAGLASGNSVMTFIWDTWFYTDFTPGKYTLEDFALMPVFMNTTDRGSYEGGNLNMMMVNKNSPRLEEALEFLDFCARPENYNAAFEGIATVSCFKGQTGNIQSQMVTAAAGSIEALERVSTASTKIMGYSADDVMSAFEELFRGETDVAGCVKRMDEYRIGEAHLRSGDV